MYVICTRNVELLPFSCALFSLLFQSILWLSEIYYFQSDKRKLKIKVIFPFHIALLCPNDELYLQQIFSWHSFDAFWWENLAILIIYTSTNKKYLFLELTISHNTCRKCMLLFPTYIFFWKIWCLFCPQNFINLK